MVTVGPIIEAEAAAAVAVYPRRDEPATPDLPRAMMSSV